MSRSSFFASLVGLLLFVAFAPVPHDWDVKKYAPSVLPLESEKSYCSCVLVGNNGVYLTAYHCIVNGVIAYPPAAKILAADEATDLVVFQAPVIGKPLPVASAEPEPGDQVLALGYGNASPRLTPIPSWWIGNVGPEAPTLYAAGAILGMSGGPVVNRRGQIVGLVSAVWDVPVHRVTGVIRLGAIQEAVKRWAK